MTGDNKGINKVFVYGIFLDEDMRDNYGMSNPDYATVQGYATFGDYIVQAAPVKNMDACLTGLVCDVAPKGKNWQGELVDNWARLDRLEGGYDRELITTTGGVQAWMYVAKGAKNA